jgi:hypothetical protein
MNKKCFMVFWMPPEDGVICLPMGWDKNCEGALAANTDNPVLFESRQMAQQCIRISKACTALLREQGVPYNEDWLPCNAKQICVLPVTVVKETPDAE